MSIDDFDDGRKFQRLQNYILTSCNDALIGKGFDDRQLREAYQDFISLAHKHKVIMVEVDRTSEIYRRALEVNRKEAS